MVVSFFYTPIRRETIQFDEYFSDGFKPQTSFESYETIFLK